MSAMHECILYDKLDDGRVHCLVCPRDCRIADGRAGFCGVRHNRGGRLYAITYGKITSAAADPIEKKPLFHFHPGTQVFSLGSAGCNLRCAHCQNWQIAHERLDGAVDGAGALDLPGLSDLSPAQAVAAAKANGCAGIAWTYNEPTIWLEYTIDSAKLCREAGLYTVYVTNGYATEAAVDAIGPHLDAYRVDVKGFTDAFYKKLAGVANWRTILTAAERAKHKWGCHVEIVTNVIPTMNDDDAQLRDIAEWIVGHLGPETPWHVTRFMPYLDLASLPPTPASTLNRARQIGMDAGLKFVYIGNDPGNPGENTYCPGCGRLVIERSGYATAPRLLQNGKCAECGQDLNICPAG
jgi:pyruvate formate lyase activating enzyme